MNLLDVAGIAYDIIGAVFIARAIVFTGDKILLAQASTYFDMNPALFAALENQRLDGRYGLGILVAGFALQLLAALGVTVALPYWPAFLVPVGFALAGYYFEGKRFARNRAERIKRHIAEVSGTA